MVNAILSSDPSGVSSGASGSELTMPESSMLSDEEQEDEDQDNIAEVAGAKQHQGVGF